MTITKLNSIWTVAILVGITAIMTGDFGMLADALLSLDAVRAFR